MRLHFPVMLAVLLPTAIAPVPLAMAQFAKPTLTYVPGSSVNLYQINGDCDRVQWDATITNTTPTCNPTFSLTTTRADILDDDVAASFESNG
jgi:hypothetical protein